MKGRFTPKVITGNDLLLGDVVYFTASGTWSRQHAEAELINDEALSEVRLTLATKDKNAIVGIYLADARAGENGPEPVHFREEFRTKGPSNYLHGKQEHV